MRRAEEGVVAHELRLPTGLVLAPDAGRSVEGLGGGDLALAVDAGIAPVVGQVRRHVAAHHVGRDGGRQPVAGGAGRHDDCPRLRVAVRRRPAGEREGALDVGARQRLGEKGTGRRATRDDVGEGRREIGISLLHGKVHPG